MTPYLVTKIVWVVGALMGLLPTSAGMSVPAFVGLNLVTIGLAVPGILLGLMLARRRPGGRAGPILLFGWVGSGFLVPLIPSLVRGFFTGSGAELWLIQGSFLAMALCLLVAVPLYLAERWPSAYTRPAPPALALLPLLSGAVALYWTLGGQLGLAHPAARDTDWYLTGALTAAWALAGAWAMTRRGRLAAAVTWFSSGLLFAWSAWRLPFTVLLALRFDPTVTWPENLGVAGAVFAVNIVAGLLMVRSLIRSTVSTGDSPRPLRPALAA
jgi:hypothetical protein